MIIDPKRVAIIGMGPAGVSAAIYLKRYGMEPVCFEKELIGGKVNKTEKIENYPGLPSLKGPDFALQYESQLSFFNIEVNYEEVTSVTLNEDGSFLVKTDFSEEVFAYVILAIGLGEKPYSIPGEESFKKRGISRCAICDGMFYRGKDVAVIGAGTSAFEEATYLSDICSSVSLIARRTEFRAQKAAVDQFLAKNNTKIYTPYLPVSVSGKDSIESMTIQNVQDNSTLTLSIQGLFLYIGDSPWVNFVKIDGVTNERGYLVVDRRGETKVKHLYACGDCTDTLLRQVVTASSDGALVATSIHDNYQNQN